MKTFSLVMLLIFISVGFASAQSRPSQDQACSSINNLPLNKGAKSLLLNHCAAALAAKTAGLKFSSVGSGKLLGGVDNSADLGNCGHPTQEFYFETGFQKYLDSDGGDFQGDYVYVDFVDRDCDGNFLSETTCQLFVPPGVVEINPFKNAFVIADVDLVCSDQITRHLTTNNTNVTVDGFIGSFKSKETSKRETFTEKNTIASKDRRTSAPVGEIIFNGHTYDLTIDDDGGSWIGTYTVKYAHEDF